MITVKEGQIRDRIKNSIQREVERRQGITEAAQYLRQGAGGKALEVLEGLMQAYQAQDREDQAEFLEFVEAVAP